MDGSPGSFDAGAFRGGGRGFGAFGRQQGCLGARPPTARLFILSPARLPRDNCPSDFAKPRQAALSRSHPEFKARRLVDGEVEPQRIWARCLVTSVDRRHRPRPPWRRANPRGWSSPVFTREPPPDVVRKLARLRRSKEVIAVVRGCAFKGGKRTTEPAFVVFVRRKRKALPPSQVFPRYLTGARSSFRVDVLENRSFSTAYLAAGNMGGTVASIAVGSGADRALIAAHVAGPNGDVDKGDYSWDTEVGGVRGDTVWSRLALERPYDHAVVRLPSGSGLGAGHPRVSPLIADLTRPAAGQAVKIWSEIRGGSWSHGILVGYVVDHAIQVGPYWYRGVAVIRSTGSAFSVGGDSGALVFTHPENRAIGMVAGRSALNTNNESFGVVVPLGALPLQWRRAFFGSEIS